MHLIQIENNNVLRTKEKTLTGWLKRLTPSLRNSCEGFLDRQYIVVQLLMRFLIICSKIS
jgi:hypothetical protein